MFGEIAATIDIVSALFIGRIKSQAVFVNTSRQPAGERPETFAASTDASNPKMREEPRHPSVTVLEGMHPYEPMMRGHRRHETSCSRGGGFLSIESYKAIGELAQCIVTRRNMATYRNLVCSNLPGYHFIMGTLAFVHQAHFRRQPVVYLSVDASNGFKGNQLFGRQVQIFHCLLRFQVRHMQKLFLAHLLLFREIPLERIFDFMRLGAVSFNQVRVISVH